MSKLKVSTILEYAEYKDIIITRENLGSVLAYYNEVDGHKFIHLNENLTPIKERFLIGNLIMQSAVNPEKTIVKVQDELGKSNKLEHGKP